MALEVALYVTTAIDFDSFPQGVAQTLGHAALNLAYHRIWVDRPADLLAHEIAVDGHVPGDRIDFDLGDVYVICLLYTSDAADE